MYFAKRPFTLDMLDLIGAHICQAVIEAASGKRSPIERHLIIKRDTADDAARRGAEALRARLGG